MSRDTPCATSSSGEAATSPEITAIAIATSVSRLVMRPMQGALRLLPKSLQADQPADDRRRAGPCRRIDLEDRLLRSERRGIGAARHQRFACCREVVEPALDQRLRCNQAFDPLTR